MFIRYRLSGYLSFGLNGLQKLPYFGTTTLKSNCNKAICFGSLLYQTLLWIKVYLQVRTFSKPFAPLPAMVKYSMLWSIATGGKRWCFTRSLRRHRLLCLTWGEGRWKCYPVDCVLILPVTNLSKCSSVIWGSQVNDNTLNYISPQYLWSFNFPADPQQIADGEVVDSHLCDLVLLLNVHGFKTSFKNVTGMRLSSLFLPSILRFLYLS